LPETNSGVMLNLALSAPDNVNVRVSASPLSTSEPVILATAVVFSATLYVELAVMVGASLALTTVTDTVSTVS
jgi:hypothetical protein